MKVFLSIKQIRAAAEAAHMPMEELYKRIGIAEPTIYYRDTHGWRYGDALHLAEVLGVPVDDLKVPEKKKRAK